MIDQIKPLLGKLCAFSQERMGFSHPPKLFLKTDKQNSKQALGKTAYYDPGQESVTLFVHGRHPKDILRSFAHELVHHAQNLRGDLSQDKMAQMGKNYAQDNEHMRNMEKEAYLKGNMCFRDWEDTIEDKDKFLIKLAESKFLKESKTMTTKITEKFLRNTIRNILSEKIDGKELANALMRNDREALRAADKELEAKAAAKKKKKKKSDKAVATGDPKPKTEDISQMKADLEVVDGAPTGAEMETDLVISSLLEDTLKKIQEQQMISLEEAMAALKAEIEKQEARGIFQPRFEPLEEGSGCATRKDDIEEEKKKGKFDDGDDKDEKCDYVDCGDDDKEEKDDDSEKEKKEESKIRTPEQENALYEQRFTPKNNRLFEKLVKEWTK